MIYKMLYSALVVLCCCLNGVSQNSISLQTVFETSSEPFSLEALGDQAIWRLAVNDTFEVHYYNGHKIDILNSPGTLVPNRLALTKNTVAWSVSDLAFTSGSCTGAYPTSYALYDDILIDANTPCVGMMTSNGNNYIRVFLSGPYEFEIVANNKVIFRMPKNFKGLTFSISNILSYSDDYIFFKGAFQTEGSLLGQGILRYNVKTDQLNLTYRGREGEFFTIPQYKHDETMIIISRDELSFQKALYYNNGTGLGQLLVANSNVLNSEVLKFQNSIYWVTTESELIRYDLVTGLIDTMENDSVAYQSLNSSDCYVTWSLDDFTTFESTLHVNDGTTTMTQDLDGVFNSFNRLQLDNEGFTGVLYNANLADPYRIVRGVFNLPCCTGEDVITNLNRDERSLSYIESSSVLNCNLSASYKAVDYIEMNAGFEVVEDATFDAEITGACFLSQE